jgi:hypothetical protein
MLEISILILRWILKLLQRSNIVSFLENLRRKKKYVLPSALQQKVRGKIADAVNS